MDLAEKLDKEFLVVEDLLNKDQIKLAEIAMIQLNEFFDKTEKEGGLPEEELLDFRARADVINETIAEAESENSGDSDFDIDSDDF
jgi:hypothetical protein